MIKQTGTVSSYKELGEQFLNFVQRGNDTTQPWEVIDDRLDSFYGATIKFPVSSMRNDIGVSSISMPKLYSDISEVVLFSVSDFWHTASPGHMKSGQNILESVFSPVNTESGRYDNFVRLIDCLYECRYTGDIFTDSLFVYDNAPNIPYTSYNSSTGALPHTDLDKYYDFMNNIDPLNTIALRSEREDFSCLSGKKQVIILFPISTCFYYLKLEYIYNKVVNYLISLQNKLLNELIRNNSSVNRDDLHVDILLCYVYNEYIDLLSDGTNVRFTDDSSQALNNYLLYLKNNLKENFFFVNFLDILSNNYYSSLVSTLLSHGDNDIIFDDIGEKCPLHSFTGKFGPSYRFDMPWLVEVDYHVKLANLDTGSHSGSGTDLFLARIWRWDILANMTYMFRSKSDADINSRGIEIKSTLSPLSYAYISLQYNKITPTTYNEWLTNTKDNYMSESFDSRRRIPATYGGAETWRTVTISNQYQHDVANIFKDTGEVLFISPHIKYDKNLWMCEQGGIACDQETRTQNIEDNCIRHRKLTQNFGGYASQAFVKVPPFPSLGCPMLTINDEQLDQGQINYYFIRDNTSASIVVYVPSLDSLKYDYYVQHISFGVLDCFSISEQFMYPLYVGGGSGGLYHDHWSYYSPGSGVPSHEIGNIYKLDMENTSISNSNILLSAKFNGANVSNFRVLCPDGHWDNIFNVSQNASLIVDPYACWPDSWTTRYYVLQQPIVGGSELGDARYGGTTTLNGANSIKRIDTGYIEPEYRDTELDKYSKTSYVSTPIQPVMPVFSSHKIVSLEGWPRHRYGVLGKIPRCYSTWSRNLRFGELEINGKKFLAIPNAHDQRKWYPAYDVHVDFANLESYLKSKENVSSEIYNDFIYDYLLLSLED